MTINYLILAHTNPFQVKKMVVALNQENTRFYVHIDLKTNPFPFREALKDFSNLYLIPEGQREHCNWGGIGIVKATLTMLKRVADSDKNGYSILLSGQDYPIRNGDYIKSFFQKNAGVDFISSFPLPTPYWTNGGKDRIHWYKIDLSDKRGDFVQLPSFQSKEFYSLGSLKKLLKLTIRKKGREIKTLLPSKTFPAYIIPYGGDTWWALGPETTSKILTFLKDHPDLLRYMEHSNLPDEMLFQSLVWEIHKESPNKIKHSLTYANWSGKDEPSPRFITAEDIQKIKDLPDDYLFARKFDLDRNPEILNQIEKEVWTIQK
ncbi:beta-1,6-N-acetylglucosaminyltransferase [Cyclobacterium sp. SYSU L10401]|uniref:beta-1,6-N-acetylglucosaminyltransferase n=2 Tax=unclassified Cyclobacterium TaxID=2615055 RepID=UPI0013D74DD6|nr:beta-1,6-N-acetylglucosaminyltransferase [Cyclobacterium sp. SYSU L10401]